MLHMVFAVMWLAGDKRSRAFFGVYYYLF